MKMHKLSFFLHLFINNKYNHTNHKLYELHTINVCFSHKYCDAVDSERCITIRLYQHTK